MKTILYLLHRVILYTSISSSAVSESLIYKGFRYDFFESNIYVFEKAVSQCFPNLLWISDETEVDWLHSNFQNLIYWTSLSSRMLKWPNGQSLPASPKVPNHPAGNTCLTLRPYQSRFAWNVCQESHAVICKVPVNSSGHSSTTPTTTSIQSTSPTSIPTVPPCRTFIMIASGQRLDETVPVLLKMAQKSRVTCASLCHVTNACRGFEWRVNGFCRLATDVRANPRVLDPEAQLFSMTNQFCDA